MNTITTPDLQSDAKLVKALKERKPEAVERFYEQYASAIYGNIKRSLYKDDVSEETLRNVFNNILNAIDEFEPGQERLFTWTLKIAQKEIRRQKIDLVLNDLFAR